MIYSEFFGLDYFGATFTYNHVDILWNGLYFVFTFIMYSVQLMNNCTMWNQIIETLENLILLCAIRDDDFHVNRMSLHQH